MATDRAVLDFVESLATCASIDEAWETYNAELAKYGVEHACYGFMATSPRRSIAGEVLTFSSHKAEFTDAYMREGHPDHDWSVEWSIKHVAPRRWRTPAILESLTDRQKVTEQLAYDFGLYEGLVIPIRGNVPTSWGGVGLAAPGLSEGEWGRVLEAHQPILEKITHAFHETVLGNGFYNVFGLTARETEVLDLVVAGLDKHDIADRLSISHRTAEVHIYRLREKLNCVNDAQLVAKALVYNLVAP
jgi:DNA-binding CsgD family transcriptional regulator